MNIDNVDPLILAAAGLLVLYALLSMLAGSWNPIEWARGADGRVSSSKLQFLLWTVVIAFAYLAVSVTRLRQNLGPDVENPIPGNVLIALGFSGTTVAAAKGITQNKIDSRDLSKVPLSAQAEKTAAGIAGAFQGDDGSADLTKIQMMLWTFVALGSYLIRLFSVVHASDSNSAALPDIDPSLMVLTGLAQGAYLGKKLVTNETPRLYSLDPKTALVGAVITISGASLGRSADGNMLLLNGMPVTTQGWTDTEITFKLAETNPATGAAWPKGVTRAKVAVISGGKDAANFLALDVTGK
jgi:hypothetical protein